MQDEWRVQIAVCHRDGSTLKSPILGFCHPPLGPEELQNKTSTSTRLNSNFVTLSTTVKSSAAPCTLLLLLKRGGTTLLFHHKLQTRNHGDTPHKKDLMMLMIERCAMVVVECLISNNEISYDIPYFEKRF